MSAWKFSTGSRTLTEAEGAGEYGVDPEETEKNYYLDIEVEEEDRNAETTTNRRFRIMFGSDFDVTKNGKGALKVKGYYKNHASFSLRRDGTIRLNYGIRAGSKKYTSQTYRFASKEAAESLRSFLESLLPIIQKFKDREANETNFMNFRRILRNAHHGDFTVAERHISAGGGRRRRRSTRRRATRRRRSTRRRRV
jgi:hypothetical protein